MQQKSQKDALLFFRRFVVDIVASLPLTYLTLIYSLAAEGSNQPAGNLSFAKTLRMVRAIHYHYCHYRYCYYIILIHYGAMRKSPFLSHLSIYVYNTIILPRQARDKHRTS